MPKLAIYVSKPDMREIEPWRKQFNFSRIFMGALRQEIRDQTRAAQAPDGKVAAAAAHYKRMLVERSGPLVDFGYELGVGQVIDCKLPSETIRKLLEIKDFDATCPDDVQVVREAIGKQNKAVQQFGKENNYNDETDPTWGSAVMRGYLKGVAAAWKRVCQQME